MGRLVVPIFCVILAICVLTSKADSKEDVEVTAGDFEWLSRARDVGLLTY